MLDIIVDTHSPKFLNNYNFPLAYMFLQTIQLKVKNFFLPSTLEQIF